MRSKLANLVGLLAAGLHVALFFATLFYIQLSGDPQAPLTWGIWALVDFPVSMLYMIGGTEYSSFLHSWDGSWFAKVLYLPHLLHGLLGAIQWFFLPRLFMPKRLGGVWGSSATRHANNLSKQAMDMPTQSADGSKLQNL